MLLPNADDSIHTNIARAFAPRIHQMTILFQIKMRRLITPHNAIYGSHSLYRSSITSPLSRARTANSVRLRKPVFPSMLTMCDFTVLTDM